MKNKLFSRGLYVEALRQLRLTGIIFLAVLLLIGIAVPVLQFVSYLEYMTHFAEEASEYTPEVVNFIEMCFMEMSIAFVAAPIFTFIIFGAFNKRSASDFYHSLPYTRICMYLSNVAAIFTWLAGLTVVYCGVTIAVFALMPQVFIVTLSGMLDVMLTVIAVSMMLVFGIICGMSLTGTPIANITCTGLILFLPRLLITLVTLVLGELAPIAAGHYGIFNMDYNVLFGVFYEMFEGGSDTVTGNIAADIYSICIGIVYAVIAAILFCKRKSETSGHSAPGRRSQSVIRICVGFVVSSIVTCAMLSGLELSVCVVFYIVAIIVYFAYELITQKTFKTIPKTLPGLGILIVLNILIAVVCMGSAAVVHSYSPADGDIAAIYIKNGDSYIYHSLEFREYAAEKAGKIKIEDKEAISIAAENLRENVKRSKDGTYYMIRSSYPETEGEYYQYVIEFVSKRGVRRTRNLYVPMQDYMELMNEVRENEDYKNVFLQIPDAIHRTININEVYNYNRFDLSEQDYRDILSCMQEEVKSLDFAKWTSFLMDSSYRYDTGFQITYGIEGADYDLNIPFTNEILPKTTQLLMDRANDGKEEQIEKFYEVIADIEAAEKEMDYIYINATSVGGEDDWHFHYHYNERDDYYEGVEQEELADQLKSLGEAMKSGKASSEKYVIAYIEYSKGEESEYISVFLPYPENFEASPLYFDVYENDTEDSYKYIEYYRK